MITGIGALGQLSPFGIAEPGRTPQTSAASETGATFATALADAAARSVDRLERAEQLSVAALQGKADTREVVDAVMSAEQTMQAAVAIRDKIVTAYLEISRMPI